MNWKIGGVLPPENGAASARGLAGPLVGEDHDIMIIGGGANFPGAMPWEGGRKKYYNKIYSFKKDGNDSLHYLKSFYLPYPLAYAASCNTPRGILVAGGENDGGLSNRTFLIHWEPVPGAVRYTHLPHLPFALANASAVCDGETVYIAGGERISDVSESLYSLNLEHAGEGWKEVARIPHPVSHAVMAVQPVNGHKGIFLIGGRQKHPGGLSEFYASTLFYDLQTAKWYHKNPLPYPLSAGTGIAAPTGYLLLFGGDTGETFHKTEALIAAIGSETDAERKRQLNDRKAQVQTAHPGFSRQVLLYDIQKDQWEPTGCMPFDAPVTTTAIRWEGKVWIPTGEVRAGVRTPNILSVDIQTLNQ